MKPIEVSNRIDLLDYLRGFALLGIILVNVLSLLSARVPVPHSADAVYQRFLFLFVEGRFYPLFSFLFGVGFYLFITRAFAKGNNGYVLYLRRIIFLFIFGFIHLIFHPGEALTVYACGGFLLLPFYKVKKEINLALGLVFLVILAIVSVKVFLALPLMLVGLASGQYRLFEGITQKLKKVVMYTDIMLFFSILLLIYQYVNAPAAPFVPYQSNRFLKIGLMVGPIFSAFYGGLFIILLQVPIIQKFLSPIKAYGRMALTNYVSQTALILIAGKGLDLFNHITYLHTFFLCLTISFIQIIFSVIWLRFFRFGPLEWLWRLLTYMETP